MFELAKKLHKLARSARLYFLRLGLGNISALEALSRFMPIADFERLVLEVEDRRLLLAAVAQNIGQPEVVVLEQVARILKLPLLYSVREIAPGRLGSEQNYNDLVRHALIPLVVEDIHYGFACVDPCLAWQYLGSSRDIQIYMASWEQVRRALEESWGLFQSEKEKELKQKLAENKKLAQLALLQLVNEVEGYRSSTVLIRIFENYISYEFRAEDGRKGSGEIDSKIMSGLVLILNELVFKQNIFSSMEYNLGDLTVEVLSPQEAFQLNWTKDGSLVSQADSVPKLDDQEVVGIDLPPSKFKEFDGGKSSLKISSAIRAIDEQPMNVDSDQGDSQSISVLVLEDNKSFAKVINCFLTKQGFKVTLVSNGLEALLSLRSGNAPDVIVSDIHMPNMNGSEFIRTVKQIEEVKNCPIIILTSDTDVDTELQIINQGADVFLAKNADPRLLAIYINRLAKASHSNDRTRKKEAA